MHIPHKAFTLDRRFPQHCRERKHKGVVLCTNTKELDQLDTMRLCPRRLPRVSTYIVRGGYSALLRSILHSHTVELYCLLSIEVLVIFLQHRRVPDDNRQHLAFLLSFERTRIRQKQHDILVQLVQTGASS